MRAQASELPVPYSIKRHGVTLSNCDDEPVQTPGCIQSHGVLIALRRSDLVATQVSDNCERFTGLPAAEVLGATLGRLVGARAAAQIEAVVGAESLDANPRFIVTSMLPGAAVDDAPMDMSIHVADGVLLLEMEPGGRTPPVLGQDGDYFSLVRNTIGRLKATATLAEFCDVVASEARSITGLDRAMVYQFHADDSGEVRADARRDDLPSWKGLRYPASDIPKPARDIFMRIGVRPLPDAQGSLSEMVPLRNPDTGRPLDMTHCALRGASLMYTEYLHNMGVAATLTMPIVCHGRLWGLIACHHQTPRALPYALRSAAEFLAQVTSLEIVQAELREHLQYRIRLDESHLVLLARAAGDGQLHLQSDHLPGLLDGIEADGVALFQRGQWTTTGATPDVAELKALSPWLRERIAREPAASGVHATDALAMAYAPASAFPGLASGVLATSISKHPESTMLLWFRSEQVQTFAWAGNPHLKPLTVGANGPRLTPRRSFELWQELVRGRSRPWTRLEIESVQKLRRMIVELVAVRADRLAVANAELAASNAELDDFAYVAGHDLKEPLRGINKSAHRILDDAIADRRQDTERIERLLRLTVRMDALLDALLHFSQVGRLVFDFRLDELGPVLVEATEMLGARLAESGATVRVPRPMPAAVFDRIRVREVLSNLISNAAKYNDKPERWIEVGYIAADERSALRPRPDRMPAGIGAATIFYVADNGIGIDDDNRTSVFTIFRRLHANDDFGGGSGAGLTIVKKMVEQHGGRVWFDAEPGAGTTFYFTLPVPEPSDAAHDAALDALP